MKCQNCGHLETKVLESRNSHESRSVRRRRECTNCHHRFTTYEREESFVFSVQKKDGSVEPYKRQKILQAMQTACQKRPVQLEMIESSINNIERKVQELGRKTIPSQQLGDMVMDTLKSLDQVAYVRFASVYKEFKDPTEFMHEINSISAVEVDQ